MSTAIEYFDKTALSYSSEGHKMDEENARDDKEYLQKRLKSLAKYSKKSPGKAYLLGNDPSTKFTLEVARNRSARLERLHKKKENSYNPLAGWSDNEMKKK